MREQREAEREQREARSETRSVVTQKDLANEGAAFGAAARKREKRSVAAQAQAAQKEDPPALQQQKTAFAKYFVVYSEFTTPNYRQRGDPEYCEICRRARYATAPTDAMLQALNARVVSIEQAKQRTNRRRFGLQLRIK